jgi:hypothetical protein
MGYMDFMGDVDRAGGSMKSSSSMPFMSGKG